MSTSSSTYLRWGGLASMLGGVLLSGSFVVILFVPEYIGTTFFALFLYVWVSLLAGLIGLHARHKGRYGAAKWLARVGLIFAVVGPLQSVFLGLLPFLAMGFGLVIMGITTALLTMGFGLVLMGIATIKANVLRWKALPLLMGLLGVAVWGVHEATMQPGGWHRLVLEDQRASAGDAIRRRLGIAGIHALVQRRNPSVPRLRT